MRQRRDKARLQNPDHHGIPLDAEGVPIVLVLPPTVRAQYEENIAACEAAWREGEPLAVAEATTWTRLYRQPIPKWLEQAIVELAMGKRSQQQAKRHVEATIRLQRYMTVRDLKLDIDFSTRKARRITEISWDDAYAKAAELLAKTPMAGSAETMKRDYCTVQGDLNAGRGGKYFTLKDRRYRLNGKSDPTKLPLA